MNKKIIAGVMSVAMLASMSATPIFAEEVNRAVLSGNHFSFGATQQSTEIKINKTNFPDDNFRVYVNSFDTDRDGSLSEAEIQAVTEIDCNGFFKENNKIKSLKGIKYFTVLTELNCSYNELSSLDINENTALTELDCSVNQLESIDVSSNTELTKLDCNDNKLENLNVSENTKLTELDCSVNQLKSIDVSNNTALTELMCVDNLLESIDVSSNTALTGLYCDHNNLWSINVNSNTALKKLFCHNSQISSLDLTSNTALDKVSADFDKRQIEVSAQHPRVHPMHKNTPRHISNDISRGLVYLLTMEV